jgi:DNA-binding XRE family transcriptional regulator
MYKITNIMKNIIYGLKDPRNDVFQYIGKSTIGDKRALQHLTKSHSDKVNEWIETLNNNWQYPIVEIIEEVTDINDLIEREKYYINYYHNLNLNLLNIQCIDNNINILRSEENEKDFNELSNLIFRIPTILKNERICRKLTQSEMAEKIGVSRSTIVYCENGSNVSIDIIKKYLLELKGIDILTKELSERVRK